MSYEWDPRLEKGIAQMDATHREFVDLVDALVDAGDEELIPQLQVLLDHTREHFAQENSWMEESGFPPIAIHQGEHQRVLDLMEHVLQEAREGDPGQARNLVQQLPAWFEQHAMTMDAALARHLHNADHPVAV